jgi:hypothetical protein
MNERPGNDFDGALVFSRKLNPQVLFPVHTAPMAVTVPGIESARPFDALLARRRAKMTHFVEQRRRPTFWGDRDTQRPSGNGRAREKKHPANSSDRCQTCRFSHYDSSRSFESEVKPSHSDFRELKPSSLR